MGATPNTHYSGNNNFYTATCWCEDDYEFEVEPLEGSLWTHNYEEEADGVIAKGVIIYSHVHGWGTICNVGFTSKIEMVIVADLGDEAVHCEVRTGNY